LFAVGYIQEARRYPAAMPRQRPSSSLSSRRDRARATRAVPGSAAIGVLDRALNLPLELRRFYAMPPVDPKLGAGEAISRDGGAFGVGLEPYGQHFDQPQ
jgi:hypothetical protein